MKKLRDASSQELRGICQRAEMEITVNTPLLQQRDDAEREARFWKAKAEENANKLSERKTVHEWLNSLGTPDVEGTGKPLCLLRRLAVQLGIQPHFAEGSTREEYRRAIRGCAVSLDMAFSSRDETGCLKQRLRAMGDFDYNFRSQTLHACTSLRMTSLSTNAESTPPHKL